MSRNGDYQSSFEIGRQVVKELTGYLVMNGKAEVQLLNEFLQYQPQNQPNESGNKHCNSPDKPSQKDTSDTKDTQTTTPSGFVSGQFQFPTPNTHT